MAQKSCDLKDQLPRKRIWPTEDEIVVSGISGRYPESNNLDEFWDKLVSGVEMSSSDDRRWPLGYMNLPIRSGKIRDVHKLDADFFGIREEEANFMDPQIRILHETTFEAIIDAGINPETLRGSKTAVFVGICYIDSEAALKEDYTKAPGYKQYASSRISYAFDFKGPSFSTDTACASSFSAFHKAVTAMRVGECDQAIVGGVAINLRPSIAYAFHKLSMISPDGRSKCMDASADGYCRSEAVVSILLQKRKDAKRIYATVLNTKTNTDGYKPEGITFPSMSSQRRLMRETYAEAGVDPLDVKYMEAHMTGTNAGDPVESQAIVEAICKDRTEPLLLGCLKSNIGHTEGASGACAITKACLILQRREIPPNIHFKNPHPDIEGLISGILKPVTERTKFDGDLIGVNSFGFGGCNVHAVLKANEKIVSAESYKLIDTIPRIINVCGRTSESVTAIFVHIEKKRSEVTREWLALLNDAMRIDPSSGMTRRGFMIIDEVQVLEKKVKYIKEKKPLWFVFSALGCQWPSMGKALMGISVCAKSIETSAQIVKPLGLDLMDLILSEDKSTLKSLVETFIAIVSIQIALVDLLYHLDIQPDGIVGHSAGEIACGYADGCMTSEQTLLTAYNIAKIACDLQTQKGAMGTIGLSSEEAEKRCPPGVYVGCNNANDSVTVSGYEAQVRVFLNQLTSEGIFAREVDSCSIPFHSKCVQNTYQPITDALRNVLTKPKMRSSRWLSTSVPMERWHEDEFRYLGPTYYPNSMVSQVQFKEVFRYIPKNVAIVEVGPQDMLLPLLERGLGPDVDCIQMMKRDNNEQNLGMVLSSIGQIYANGHNPAIERLYPKLEYPVSRETPSISPLIQWDHSKDRLVPKLPDYFNMVKENSGFSIDLMEPRFQYLSGHCVDGRILFPATGYLWMIWQRLASLRGYSAYSQVSVEFRQVALKRATIMSKTGLTSFKLIIIPETGQFAVTEGESVCVTGFVFLAEEGQQSTDELEKLVIKRRDTSDAITLNSKDIYKELRIRGYDYGPTFQGLVEASSGGGGAKVKWLGNWISFTDSLLQLAILGQKTRGLLLPTFIEYLKCDVKTMYQEMKSSSKQNDLGETEVDVFFDKNINVGVSTGIVIKGLKASPAPRRQNAQMASVESYGFLPYNETTFIKTDDIRKLEEYSALCRKLISSLVDPHHKSVSESDTIKSYLESHDEKYSLLRLLDDVVNQKEVLSKDTLKERLAKESQRLSQDITLSLPFSNERLIRPHIDIVIENMTSKKLNIVEANTTHLLMHSFVANLMDASSIGYNYTLLHPSPATINKATFGSNLLKLSSEVSSSLRPELIIFKDYTTSFLFNAQAENMDVKLFLESSFNSLIEGGFLLILSRFCVSSLERQLMDTLNLSACIFHYCEDIKLVAESQGFVTVSERFDGISCQSLLMRKPFVETKDDKPITISVQVQRYEWVRELKTHLVENKDTTRVWLIADDTPNNGIVGLVNCLRKEPGGERVRCVFQPPGEGKPGHALTPDILRKDLVMNVYRNGAFGSFRHFMVNNAEEVADIEHAYIDIKTKGDLSSFRWFEADHKHWPSLPDSEAKRKQVLCSVYYSALNFKDVMVATGRIPTDAYPSEFMGTGLIGMEFSGRDQSGNRIMGFTATKAIATTILLADAHFVWKVPDDWTLEQASTAPVVYVTAYYALLIRGNLRHGDSVLIHAGSGGVGQAAISICLSMGCKVYTTVGSESKRRFLKQRFPKLTDEQIANSRDTSFEEQILRQTDGRGVDIVLNSLAEDKLQASVRCLADFGRFLEIGKYDLIQNNPMDISDLGRNKTFHVVCVAHLDVDAFFNKSPQALLMCLRIKQMVTNGLDSGEVIPLKTHLFDKNQVEAAFRFMASGKHIGKVVIKIRDEEPQTKVMPKPVAVTAIRQTFFHPLKSYVITGGLGGFGLELTSWLISRGAKNVVLSSRSGFKDSFQRLAVKRFDAEGGTVIVSNNDMTTFVGAAALLQEAENMGPVGGIFHLAMVLKDALLENQTVEAYQEACASKVQGTVNLDKLTRQTCPQLDYFVCFSSVVSGRGNAGQTNYGFANSVMERTCEVRRKDGLPGMAIQWGAIGDVGVVAESMGGNNVIIGGTLPQRLPSCLEVMDQFLQSHHTVCSSIVKADNKKTSGGGRSDLVQVICHVLGIKDHAALDPNTTLGNLGLDSLMAVEIRQGLERDYDVVLTTQDIRELKIKDIKVIDSKKKAKGNAIVPKESMICETRITLNLTEDAFIQLNDSQNGKPIFFIPPIEGNFKLLQPLAKYVVRPVIGLNWTAKVDSLASGSVQDIAKHYIQVLRQSYPDSHYDLVGYSFGAMIALEIGIQLQSRLKTVSKKKKMLLLDSSPAYLKSATSQLYQKDMRDDDKASLEMLLEFVSLLVPTENSAQVRDSLLKLSSAQERNQLVSTLITDRSGLVVDPNELTAASERYFKKVKLIRSYESSQRFEGDVKLIKATEEIKSMSRENFLDYGLSQIISGNCEVVAMDGDHKTFLSNNSEAIGTAIDNFYQYLAFA